MNTFAQRIGVFGALCAMTFAVFSVQASSLFDGTASNVWVFDATSGVQIATFDNANGIDWTLDVGELSDDAVEVGSENGSIEIENLNLEEQYVLVNNLNGSLQFFDTGLDPALPSMSMQGLQPPTNFVGSDDLLTVSAKPAGGSFTTTTEVLLTATPDPSSQSGTFSFFIVLNGDGNVVTVTVPVGESAEHKLYLLDGAYDLSVFVQNGGNQSGVFTANYTVTNAEGPFGDTDKDGIPDAVEVEWGANPLSNDVVLDSDGDGWSDLEERLRGTDPADAQDEPVDTDGDGWPDFDEVRRGTDPTIDFLPQKWTSKPAASRYTEVEYVLNGAVFEDAAQSTVQEQITEFAVFDVQWRRRYDQSQLLSAEELALTAPPIGNESDLFPMFRKSEVDQRLALGQLPQDVRLAASTPMVMRARQGDLDGGLPWTAKAWLSAQPDVTPLRYGQFAADNDVSWTDANDWLSGYHDYFVENIVQPVTQNLSPQTGDAVAALEAAIAFHDSISGPAPVLLGTLNGRSAPAATLALENALAENARTLQSLIDEYSVLLGTVELQALASRSAGYYGGSIALLDATVSSSLARWLQFDAESDAPRYVARLLTTLDLAYLDSLPNLERLLLVSPGADVDSDGVDNAIELGSNAAHATNVLLNDTDADGYDDNLDPCPIDAVNLCLGVPDNTADTDGDGIVDALDNCLRVSNEDQADADNDGIGDVCVRYANIATPAADVTLLAGSSVEFTSVVTGAGQGLVLSYDWDFSGAVANSNVPAPGAVTFNDPGTYEVRLTVTNSAMASLGDDLRYVTVLPVVVDSDNDGVPDNLDGFPNDPDNSGAVVQLVEGQLDAGSYGNGFGSGQHFSKLAAEFGGVATGRWLHVQSFDLDEDNELSVYVNDTFVTTLDASGNNQSGNDSLLWLPVDSLFAAADNRVELRQGGPADSWGVTRLGLFTPGTVVGSAEPAVSNALGFDVYLGAGSTRLLEFVDESVIGSDPLAWTLGSQTLVDSAPRQIDYQLVLDESRLLLADGPLRVGPSTGGQSWAVRLDSLRALNAEFGVLAGSPTAPQHAASVAYLLPRDSESRAFSIEFNEVSALGEVTLTINQGSAENIATTPPGAWGSMQQIVTNVDAATIVTLENTSLPVSGWGVRGVSYDVLADTDLDGVDDDLDNCSTVSNADQIDADGDGFGNACDVDFNNDCIVNFFDLAAFSNEFLGSNPVFDVNSDGFVNFLDFVVVGNSFLMPPGPSGVSNICN